MFLSRRTCPCPHHINLSVELRIPRLFKQVHRSSFESYLSMSASYQFIRGVAHTPLVQTGAQVFFRVVPVHARIISIYPWSCAYPACSNRCTGLLSSRTCPCPHHINLSVELRIPRLFKQVHRSSFESYLSMPASYQFIRGVAHTPLVQTGAQVFFRVVPVHVRIISIYPWSCAYPACSNRCTGLLSSRTCPCPHHINLSRPYSSVHPACPNRCACRVLPT